MPTDFILDGPTDARVTIMLAHGAGAPMDSASMNATAKVLAGAGFRVARFEFGYMAARRTGERKPPPKAEKVMPEYVAAIDDLGPTNGPLIIGGKSMGGRVASMIADVEFAAKRVAGLLCLGYPFHPPGRPQQLRTAHLLDLKTPALICQGTRDEFGDRHEVGEFGLSDEIEVFWLEDGDHDLKPRKSISGFTTAQHLQSVADKVTEWVGRIARSSGTVATTTHRLRRSPLPTGEGESQEPMFQSGYPSPLRGEGTTCRVVGGGPVANWRTR